MGFFKKIVKHKPSLAWAIVTLFSVAFLTTANILASNNFFVLISNVFGGPRAITKSGTNAGLYVQDFETKEEAYANGNAVSKEICEEGMVLLKNDNALPLAKDAKVSVFGKNCVNLVTGGSGSAAPAQDEPVKTIFDSLQAAGIAYNPTLKAFYDDNGKSGDGRPANPTMNSGGAATLATGETPISAYTSDITGSYSSYKDAALVVFSRIAGENWDLPRRMEEDASHHYLQLDSNERALLAHVCSSGFDHVIVLINSSNNIDLGFLKFADDPAYQAKIDGAMLIGSVGAQGIMALGELLNGTVTPSGHTVDTLYTKYENDPTWQNFGDNLEDKGDSYLKPDGKKRLYYFVDYEEDIYYGYRYYETRGHIEGEDWYNKNVVYPFGYGLSYTTFSEELLNKSALESAALKADEKFEVEVRVENTGDRPGKHVVQLYVNTPYTEGGIEKAYKVLVGFAKTKLLKPNEKDTVKIEVDPYYFASYDCYDKNGNGFKGYELEKGPYTFFASTDAHHSFATFTKNLAADARFEKDPVTQTPVVNLYEDADDHLGGLMSRADFTGTFPKMPTVEDRTVTDEWVNEHLKNYASNSTETFTEMPLTGTVTAQITETDEEGNQSRRNIVLRDLLGKGYDDPMWEHYLNQFSFEELLALFNGGSYQTAAIQSQGVPGTQSCDGPTGIVAFMGTKAVYGTTYYCSEVLVAQTYNLELAEKEGRAIGNECLLGDQRPAPLGTDMPYTGWYSPGVNIHRSPFSGRNTEYYSEDPFMAGRFAASVIKAVQAKGVYTTVKHFALNDQETHRSIGGGNYWVSEQAIREIYLRPFELAVKEGKTLGVMSAFTRIGTVWTGGDYRLLTSILRKEWGFVGLVICDFHTDPYMNNRQMCYAGGDLNLTTNRPWDDADPNNVTDVSCLRRAAHNVLYVLVNSNAMRADVIGYRLPIWQVVMFIADGVIAAGLAVWGFFAIRGALKKGKEE